MTPMPLCEMAIDVLCTSGSTRETDLITLKDEIKKRFGYTEGAINLQLQQLAVEFPKLFKFDIENQALSYQGTCPAPPRSAEGVLLTQLKGAGAESISIEAAMRALMDNKWLGPVLRSKSNSEIAAAAWITHSSQFYKITANGIELTEAGKSLEL